MTKPFYPWIHRRLRPRHPTALWGGDPSQAHIGLTFDDGPSEHETPKLLGVLARHGVPGTFFLLGERVEGASKSLLEAMYAAGHQVAIHGFRHRPFPLIPMALLRNELDQTRDMIAERSGISPDEVRDVRPPFGLFTARELAHLGEWGYRTVMWTHVPPHWAQPAEQTIAELVRDTMPGDLLVLHEGRRDGPPVVELVDALIPRLLARGLGFVRVGQMRAEIGAEMAK
jgi:peptidoglycan/xylan/chitin deacetylase (PgdA/CDA1 family)